MLAPMQYRSFVWPNNPSTFEIEYRRTMHSYKLPFSGYVVQNLGLQNKIIRGTGEFIGPDAYDTFKRLAELFEENKGGRLIHPIWPEMYAHFAKLSLRQEPKEDYISYSFEFWEYKGSKFEDLADEMDKTDYSDLGSQVLGARYYVVAQEGMTLRLIAEEKSVSLQLLEEVNPTITNPDEVLRIGRLLRLR